MSDAVLVTGGAGFIGSHITDALIRRGFQVIVIDDLSHGSVENINPHAEFLHLDLQSPEVHSLIKARRISHVFHTAAQVDVQQSLLNPGRDAAVNILGTINLLEACIKGGHPKVIYSSSAAVYGEPQYLPLDEGHPVQPTSCYGISKLAPELYLKVFAQLHGLDYTVLRYANVYGPRQVSDADGGVIAIFASLLARGAAPIIYGDGGQTRDFIYVGDVVAANLDAMEKGSGEILNVSTGQSTSINYLWNLMTKLTHRELQAVYGEPRPGDIRHSVMSIDKIKRQLQWQPQVQLTEGLVLTMAWEMDKLTTQRKEGTE